MTSELIDSTFEETRSAFDYHYVYIHCRPDGSPFYVGKGSGRRAIRIRSKNRNWFYRCIVQKHGAENIRIFVSPCDSEEAAFQRERRLIASFRETGVDLANFNDGGEGSTNPSIETRQKMREAKLGKAVPGERRAKISASLKGVPKAADHVAKVANALRGRRPSEACISAAIARCSGVKQSAELIEKRISPLRGRKHTAEARAKMSLAARNRRIKAA